MHLVECLQWLQVQVACESKKKVVVATSSILQCCDCEKMYTSVRRSCKLWMQKNRVYIEYIYICMCIVWWWQPSHTHTDTHIYRERRQSVAVMISVKDTSFYSSCKWSHPRVHTEILMNLKAAGCPQKEHIRCLTRKRLQLWYLMQNQIWRSEDPPQPCPQRCMP